MATFHLRSTGLNATETTALVNADADTPNVVKTIVKAMINAITAVTPDVPIYVNAYGHMYDGVGDPQKQSTLVIDVKPA